MCFFYYFFCRVTFGVSRRGHQIYVGRLGIPITYISSLLLVEINICINRLYSLFIFDLISSISFVLLTRENQRYSRERAHAHAPYSLVIGQFYFVQ